MTALQRTLRLTNEASVEGPKQVYTRLQPQYKPWVCTLLIVIYAISHANLVCLHYINAGVYVSSGSLSGMAVSG